MANVLKSQHQQSHTNAARDISGLAGFNLSDLADEGRTRLEQCRQQIRQMMEEAEAKAEQICKEAQQRGYEQGLAEAAKDADRKLKEEAELRARDGLQLIEQAVHQLHGVHQQWMQQYADALQHITLAAAERILRRELSLDASLIVNWAREAVQMTRSSTRVTLAVHPETLAILGEALDEMLTDSDLPEQTYLEPDESVAKDAVVLRQDGGEIAAGLQTQLQRLEELLS